MASGITEAKIAQYLAHGDRPDEAALDRVYDRFATSDPFQPVTGFVDHVTMGAEALVALGLGAKAESWASRWPVRRYQAPVAGIAISSDWPEALGRRQCHGDWIAHFDAELEGKPFADVLARWVPRFSHDMGALLFHGVIRTGHATRALEHSDTPARRAELARGLALWAIGIRRAAPDPAHRPPSAGAAVDAAIDYARIGAARFVDRPSIVTLHYVTGPMAYLLISKHLDAGARRIALDSFNRTHPSLNQNREPGPLPEGPPAFDRAHILALAEQTNVHAIKLTEAAYRAFAATGEAIFLTAAGKV